MGTRKRYKVVEFEMLPIKVVMDDVDVKEIAKRLFKSESSCYPKRIDNGFIGGKYKVMHMNEKCENRYMRYFHTACVLLSKQIGKGVEDVMREVIKVSNG